MGLRNRHWKQRFSEDAEFVWNKSFLWNGQLTAVGDPIPEELRVNRNRLRMFWESGAIALSGFQAPDVTTGRAPETEEDENSIPEKADEPIKGDPEPEKKGDESPSNSFMTTLAKMGWPQSSQVANQATPETEVADWAKLSYQDQMELARSKGYEGRNMSKDNLAAYLEQHANGKPA